MADSPSVADPTQLALALAHCASEPIHLCGTIQPHGILLALDDQGLIRMASDNLHLLQDKATADWLDQPAEALLGTDNTRQCLALSDSAVLPLRIGVQSWLAQAHRSQAWTLIELTRQSDADPLQQNQLLGLMRQTLTPPAQDGSLEAYCQFICEQVRQLSGFDRVLLYRFDDKWNGAVIGESRSPVFPSLLHHHFPASDIPPQARALFSKKMLRELVDAEAENIPILPRHPPVEGQALDLGRSRLRAMSPIHIEYLRNMGVRATVTVSILHNQQLWGLIACHHQQAKALPMQQLEALECIGTAVSLKIESLQSRAYSRSMERVRQSLSKLYRLIRHSDNLERVLQMYAEDYLSLAQAGGSSILFAGKRHRIGNTPTEQEIAALETWLQQQSFVDGVFSCDSLGERYPPARDWFDLAAGLLAIDLDNTRSNFICWYRPEVVRDIAWAGNPYAKVVSDQGGQPRVEPRRSFAVWIETVMGTAEPWRQATIDAVRLFSLSLMQLLVEQARQHSDAAEAASRAKSDFLANMSHEIRTPLNGIIGLTHLCLQTPLDPHQRDYLGKVMDTSQTLLQVINDILDFSRIEAGKLKIETVPFRLSDTLDKIEPMIRLAAEGKGLAFQVESDKGSEVELSGDPLRLQQILLNLLSNAVKFTERGSITLRIKVMESVARRLRLRFEVQDTGIGMTPAQQARIFEAFEQADTSTTRRYGGSGLGLAIVRRLVALLGGSLQLDSQPDAGTRFSVQLWFEQTPGKVANARGKAALRHEKILVVADAGFTRSMLAHLLQELSYPFSYAERQAHQCHIDPEQQDDLYRLLLIDGAEPDQDLALIRQLRQHARFQSQPILLLSDDPAALQSAVAAKDIQGILPRPLERSALCEALDRLLVTPLRRADKPPQAPPVSALRGKRVLLVEDNEVNRLVGKGLLEEVGIVVTLASDGVEALQRLQQQTVDLVLMDIQMPNMDGITATRALRGQPALASLPVIAMTAHAMPEEHARCLAAGMNDLITKPVSPPLLQQMLLQYLCAGKHPSVKAKPQEDAAQASSPGLDLQAGLAHVSNNTIAYHKMLTVFRIQHGNAIPLIEEAIRQRKIDAMRQLIHKLKGAAGTIGAMQLFQQAATLESLPQDERFSAQLETMRVEMQQVLQQIDQTLAEQAPKP
ncbi:response regulator [Paludibacterium sp. B53371]|uniref:response regulator n=1 Tax=Paludibacterium sp. B53371 TaxID=2806263 RepID=UPI001C03E5C6|nr:response regulator [Paludibacterium sp. B53371]